MSKFVPSLSDVPTTNKPSRLLYHCMCRAPDPDPDDGQLKIKPSTGYGTDIPMEVRNQLGISRTEKAPLVFASDYISKTLAYAFDYHNREIALNAPIDGTKGELALVYNRDVAMAKKYDATVYCFPDKGFAELPKAPRQLVSKDAVLIDKVDSTIKIKSADDLMRQGLQIFSYKETFSELHGGRKHLENQDDAFVDKTMRERGLSFDGFLSTMIKEDKIVWENHARGINPNPVLAERLGKKIPQVNLAASPSKISHQKSPRP